MPNKPIILSKESSQFVRYAKNWFKRTDLKSDLLKIAAFYTGVGIEHITYHNVMQILLNVVKEAGLEERLKDSTLFFDIVFGSPMILAEVGKDSTPVDRVLQALVNILYSITSSDVEVQEADYSILPSRK